MRIIEGNLLTFLTRFSSAGSSVLAGITTARTLGPGGKSPCTLIILLPTLFVWLGRLGLGTSSVYFIGEKRDTVAEVTNRVISTSGIGGVLVLLGLIGVCGADFKAYGKNSTDKHEPTDINKIPCPLNKRNDQESQSTENLRISNSRQTSRFGGFARSPILAACHRYR